MLPTPKNRAFATFKANIEAARNVVKAGRSLLALTAAFEGSELNLGDMYRGAWFQAVSAFDHWAHEEIMRRVAVIAKVSTVPRPDRLSKLPITIGQSEGIRSGQFDASDIVVEVMTAAIGKTTIQSSKAIAFHMGYVKDGDLWNPVASWVRVHVPGREKVSASELRAELDAVVERRHQIAHSADLLSDGSGQKRPIDADATDLAITLLETIAVAFTEVLGILPEVKPEPVASVKLRRPDSVSLINRFRVLPGGTIVIFQPAPWQVEQLGDWLDENPDRSRAMWINDGSWNPLKWAVDGNQYSPTGLVRELFVQAGLELTTAVAGPSYWAVDGQGTLADIGKRIFDEEIGSGRR